MGWNKQSGESWELQRTMQRYGDNPQAKALALKITGFMTIEDAMKLCGALAAEIHAARRSEAATPAELAYSEAVLDEWDRNLGIETQPWQRRIIRQVVGVTYQCRKCLGPITPSQFRFGSPESGWEHMEGECIEVKAPPANIEDDDGCPND